MLKRMPLLAKVWIGCLLISSLGLLLNYEQVRSGVINVGNGALVLTLPLFVLLYIGLGYVINDRRAGGAKTVLSICSPAFVTVILFLLYLLCLQMNSGAQILSTLFVFLNPMLVGMAQVGYFLYRSSLSPGLLLFLFLVLALTVLFFPSILIGLGYFIKGRLLRRKNAANQ